MPDDPAAPPPADPARWQLAPGRSLTLDRPRILAILNLTPDSFYDGGRLSTVDDALRAAERAIADGAEALDLGAESTRPGAARISADEQKRRLIPVITAITQRLAGLGPPRSDGQPTAPLLTIDTTLASLAEEAFAAGADALNDVSACAEDPAMLPLLARLRRGVILMHRAAPPDRDRYSTHYPAEPDYAHAGGVTGAVHAFLAQRLNLALDVGIEPDAVVLDPGLGFGKSVTQNLELIRRTPDLLTLNRPILSALSRKSFTAPAAGLPADTPPADRLHPTLGLSLLHLTLGARLFRVHDVRPHAQALSAAWTALHTPTQPHQPRDGPQADAG